ncbi:SDR family NAD(P)-dependent oxidoreductase [Camelimonas abortus]|uniref:SDR family NAD(P)-dependent oxidoreductase n=1 Tax=Camelimonas abortus TaxID=1017184 RepID=UPI0035E87D43
MAAFSDMNVIITGAATGLGAATAIGLARAGAPRLVLNYASSREACAATAEACRAAGAKEVRLVQGDVSKDEDCRRIVAEAQSWGAVHALVNNAGTTLHVPHDQLDRLSAEDFHRIYGVNAVGPFQMIRAARPLLEAAHAAWGLPASVVNVSSIAGLAGVGSSVAYVASKAALNGLTVSLARALAPAIRVNALCPGYIDTPWFVKGTGQENADRLRRQVAESTPLGVAPKPEDVAEVAIFLAGPGSRYMTGELVPCDAGTRLAGPGPRRR